ncbi:hypothetical protein BDFG_03768 [Blastomyces dermatitidis ATCC 26199]|nr:hypothetical protein BDFG_03768 [Blastomyces dermatitidis ATCC 26199]
MPRSNGDIQPCPEQDSTTIPTTLPLRIFKRRLPTVPEASSTSFVKSSAPPYAIPRRHSSYAIRRPLRLSREPQYSTLPVKQDSPRSSKSHNIERHSLFNSRLLSLRTFSNNRASMDELLLPLSTCNLDVIRGLLRSVQIFQFPCDEPNLTRTSKALHEASNLLLRYSSRGALRHVFVITANLGISLLGITSNIRSRVRFHTISPEPVLVVWASEPVDGWHLSASFDEEDNDGAHALKHNLKQVMRHLRFGLDPGVLSNLSIRLDGQHGCDIEAILGETKCKALRPGEKWTILVKIKAVSEVMEELSVHGDRTQNPVDNDVDQMIDQLHGLLRASDRAISENIFTVNLEHSHSALSGPAVIKLENKCEITRFPRKKVRQALHKDVRELYGEGNALQGRVKRINSMHLSRHLDGGDNHRTSEQGKNSRERSFTSSPSHLSQHLEVYNSPQVELGSMNPFRNLVEGCDGNCFHNICSDEKVARDQAFVSPIS